MAQLQSIRNVDYPLHFFCLHKVIYGLKQALRACTRSSAPSCSLSALSHPVWTRPSLFTPVVMYSSIS